jgi:hypothetical protein
LEWERGFWVWVGRFGGFVWAGAGSMKDAGMLRGLRLSEAGRLIDWGRGDDGAKLRQRAEGARGAKLGETTASDPPFWFECRARVPDLLLVRFLDEFVR